MIAPSTSARSSPGDDPADRPRRLLLLASEGEPWGLTAAGAAEAAGYSVDRVGSPRQLLHDLRTLAEDGAGARTRGARDERTDGASDEAGGAADAEEPGGGVETGVVLAVGRSLAAAAPEQRQRLGQLTAEAALPLVVLAAPEERSQLRDLLTRGHVTVVDSPPSERVLTAVLRNAWGERDRRLRLAELQHRLEQLRDAGRREERLLARVGHELRNPLGAITTTLSLLRELHDDERSESYFQLIERQVEYLRRAVDDLLDMAGLDSLPQHGNDPAGSLPAPPPEVVAGDDGATALPEATGASGPEDGAPRPLLVVEDDPDGGAALRDLLEMWGYRVEMAREGEAGTEKALRNRPAVALVDIGLPDVDGYEVARRIRRRYPEAPPLLVAMTGFGQPEDRQRALDAGFDVHLVKPVRPAHLEELLRDRLSGTAEADARED